MFGKFEEYSYRHRPTYGGVGLEAYLSHLGFSEDAKKYARALFRFSNRKDVEIYQYAMTITTDEEQYFKHPFDHLHGFEKAVSSSLKRDAAIHIDVFTRRSFEKLRGIVDIDDPSRLATTGELILMLKANRTMLEGTLQGKERR